MVKFDIINGFVKEDKNKEVTTMKKENITPEVAGARRYWYGVLARAIKSAKRAAEGGLTMSEAKSRLVHQLVNKCSSYGEYKRMEESQFELAFMEARRQKQEREKRRAAAAAANLARRETAVAQKRARQAALAARAMEKRDSVNRIAIAIGWAVDTVADAIKAIRNGIENTTVKAYKSALRSARRARLNAASMFTAIGDLIDDAQTYVMHIIGLINEDAASDSVAY